MSSKTQLPVHIIELGNHRLAKYKRYLESVRLFGQILADADGKEESHRVTDRCYKLLKQARRHHLRRNHPRRTKLAFRHLDAIDRELASLSNCGQFDPDIGWVETTFGMIVRHARSELQWVRRFLLTAKLQEYVERDHIIKEYKRRHRARMARYIQAIVADNTETAQFAPLI